VAADFKTASQEYIFETAAPLGETQYQKSQLKAWMEPVEAPVPKFLALNGHKGIVYRDPYDVASPHLRPATPASSSSRSSSATSALLMEPVPLLPFTPGCNSFSRRSFCSRFLQVIADGFGDDLASDCIVVSPGTADTMMASTASGENQGAGGRTLRDETEDHVPLAATSS
jgi:hypothetical protein